MSAFRGKADVPDVDGADHSADGRVPGQHPPQPILGRAFSALYRLRQKNVSSTFFASPPSGGDFADRMYSGLVLHIARSARPTGRRRSKATL